MNKKTRILIADDHRIVATGVQAIFETKDEYTVVGVVENGLEVLETLQNTTVDIVIMDINMPEMNGIVCTRKLKGKYPQVKVIILTMYNRKQFIRELWDVGADGCVLKSNTGKDLLTAIERVLSGQTYFDRMNDFVDSKKEKNEYKLSEREIEIIGLVAEGLTSKEIAQRLFISEHTVKTHRKNIFRKLQVKDTDELIQFALNEGIL
ncbi:MAG: response regulator transcription factor [Crocinitomicaceae bacterium]|nr:response regulator transcription factor [Crocinitomicaceae bacterium]